VSGGDTQPGPPPPPPPSKTSGSPFGRFLTSPVLLGGVLALVLGFATLQYLGTNTTSDRPASGGKPPPTSLAGTWREAPTSNASDQLVSIRIAPDGTGAMTRGACSGTLAPTTTMSDAAVYEYTETSSVRGCPRRTQVTVQLEGEALRFEERRRGGRVLSAGTLQPD
jgi:hypothetical protein